MKLSIITPSFNQGRFIERTILSVLNQPVENLEYWVIDGGSSDETLSVLGKYQDRIQWISEPDKGQTDALNKGIRRAGGDIIGWLNSDDIYYPEALSRVMRFFAENPSVNILYGRANHIDADDKVLEPYPTRAWNYRALLEDCFICQPAVFFRRGIIGKHGLFDEFLQYCMDYEYWLRVGASEPMTFFPELLAGSRLYDSNKTLGSQKQVREEILDMVCRKIGAPSLAWCFWLGQVEAVEQGMLRDGLKKEAHFAAKVYRVVCREFANKGVDLGVKNRAVLAWWWAASLLNPTDLPPAKPGLMLDGLKGAPLLEQIKRRYRYWRS